MIVVVRPPVEPRLWDVMLPECVTRWGVLRFQFAQLALAEIEPGSIDLRLGMALAGLRLRGPDGERR